MADRDAYSSMFGVLLIIALVVIGLAGVVDPRLAKANHGLLADFYDTGEHREIAAASPGRRDSHQRH